MEQLIRIHRAVVRIRRRRAERGIYFASAERGIYATAAERDIRHSRRRSSRVMKKNPIIF
jgi:hypothetical protein